MKLILWQWFMSAMGLAAFGAVHAQSPASYPTKPIRIIMPSVPGASSELETRWYVQKIHETSNWRFILEFKPGSGGNVAHSYVAKAAPDGYTLLCTSAALPSAPALFKKLSFDAVKDLEPVTLVTEKPFLLIAKPSFPAKNVQEYISYARANPSKINFGTGGVGSFHHLAGSALHNQTKTTVTFIPYKGIGDALLALIAEQLDVSLSTTQAALPHIKAGKMRALGVTTLSRVPALSNIPTIDEQGVKGFEARSWLGYFFPRGTQAAIVNQVSVKIAAAVKDPEITRKIIADGAKPVGNTPQQFKKIYMAEITHWKKVVTDNKISID